MGAQMAGDLTKQRMNLVGQGVTQAVDALNRQAAADAASMDKLMQYQSLIKANINPLTMQNYAQGTAPSLDFMKNFIEYDMLKKAARGGYNPTKVPGTPGWYTGAPNLTPAAETPIVSGVYNPEYQPTTGATFEIPISQRNYPVQQQRSLARDILNLDIFGIQNP